MRQVSRTELQEGKYYWYDPTVRDGIINTDLSEAQPIQIGGILNSDDIYICGSDLGIPLGELDGKFYALPDGDTETSIFDRW